MHAEELHVEVRLKEESEFLLPKVAEMSLVFSAVGKVKITSVRAFRLAADLERHIQKAADLRFGRGTLKVSCYSVRPGSLIFDLALTTIWMGAAAKGVMYTLSNYSKIREGVFLLAQDLRSAREMLYKVVNVHLSRSKGGLANSHSDSSKEKRLLEQTIGGE